VVQAHIFVADRRNGGEAMNLHNPTRANRSATPWSRVPVIVTDLHQSCREILTMRLGESQPRLLPRRLPPDAAAIVDCLHEDRRAVLVLSCCDGSLHPLALFADVRGRMPAARVVVMTGLGHISFEHFARRLRPDAIVHSLSEIAPAMDRLNAATLRPHWFGHIRPLTPRETQIVEHVAAGLRNAQIANLIGIAEKTVKVNLTNIYGKLGIRTRVELSALAPELLSLATERRAAGM